MSVTVVKADPSSEITFVEDETELSHMEVRITTQRPLKWAESFDYFKEKERNWMTGLWVKIGSKAGKGNTFMERRTYKPLNEEEARAATAWAAAELAARKESAIRSFSASLAALATGSILLLAM